MNLRAHITIDLDMIEYNLTKMYEGMNSICPIMAVVKADAYGHGAVEIVKRLEDNQIVIGFATATVEEAIELRKAGIKKDILILGYTFPDTFESLFEYQLIPTVFSYEVASMLSNLATLRGETLNIHIKVDTGMGRIGFQPDEASLKSVKGISVLEGLIIDGIFTHFAKADEADKTHTMEQLRVFLAFVHRLESVYNIHIPHVHAANSAAILSVEDARLDFVRAGIAMYGICPDEAMRPLKVPIKPVLSMYSHVVHVKDAVPGSTISYGGTYEVEGHRKIATIPIGYGDGYPRGLSNKGYVLIHGQRAPIVGRICMDQCMVDVTDIEDVKLHDVVTLIGRDGDEEITVELLSDMSGVFHYELVCNLNKRVPRITI